jgi:hypothetical protein
MSSFRIRFQFKFDLGQVRNSFKLNSNTSEFDRIRFVYNPTNN